MFLFSSYSVLQNEFLKPVFFKIRVIVPVSEGELANEKADYKKN